MVMGKHDRRDGRAVGMDPVEYRLMHVTQLHAGKHALPLRNHAYGRGAAGRAPKPLDGTSEIRLRAVRREDSRRGFGLGMSQHHGGYLGYHEGEEAFAKLATAPNATIFGTELDLGADGNVTMKVALPDSGSNSATGLAGLVAEMLGFTNRDHVRLIWGDSDMAPLSDNWYGGRTITLQGAAICSAADKLRKDLLARAANLLKVDASKLQMRDGVIYFRRRSQEEHDFRRSGEGQQRLHPADRPWHHGRTKNRE